VRQLVATGGTALAVLAACGCALAAAPTRARAAPAAVQAPPVQEPAVVAVVDTGVAVHHPALAGRVLRGWSALTGRSGTADANGHGTQVAGIVAATCADCRVLPVQVAGADGEATDADIAAGIEWAARHGARIVNVSLAGPCVDPVLERAIRDAVAAGALVVAAAGNAGSTDPTACAVECGGYPAAFAPQVAGLVAVAATGADGTLLPSSNRGPWVTLAAPGAFTAPTLEGGRRAVVPGTSYAAAYVSGLAGDALALDHAATPARLRALLVATARRADGLRVADAAALEHAARR
jgi:subtilisin family serine protease